MRIGDGRCILSVGTDGDDTDLAAWYSIWAVGVALNGVCVRHGKNGKKLALGT